MREVPKKQEEEVGGGLIEPDPLCIPPGDLGYPPMPGCPVPLPGEPTDPTVI